MSRLHQALGSLVVAARNADMRRAELAWGATISAEWAHFVALGVFAYDHGGSTAVGVAGLVRLLPAAVIAPFASSLGDRFRRERFLLGLALLGAAGLAISAAGLDGRSESSSSPPGLWSASARRCSGRRSSRCFRRSRERRRS